MLKARLLSDSLIAALDISGFFAGLAWRMTAPPAAAPVGFIASADTQEGALPLANAGLDRRVAMGEKVALDGSGSRNPRSSKLLPFAWSLASLPPGSAATLSDPSAPLFIDAAGLYQIDLTVSGSGGAASSDRMALTTGELMAQPSVERSLNNPYPVAGGSVSVGDEIVLRLSAFGQTANDANHTWALVARPDSSLAELDDFKPVCPRLAVDLAGTYVTQLEASDGTCETSLFGFRQ